MKQTPKLDHIAFTVPNLDELIERLTSAFGMVANPAPASSRSSLIQRQD